MNEPSLVSSSQIIQEFNQQLFMQENPVFHKAHDFQFQPSEYDTVRRTHTRQHPAVHVTPSTLSLTHIRGWTSSDDLV